MHNYKVDFEYSFDKKDGAKKNKNKQKVKDKNYKNKSKKFHKKINEVKIPEYYEYSDSSESSF